LVTPVHTAVHGRVRFRVDGLYRSLSLKLFLEEKLLKADGISRASASTLTGTILVSYNSGQGYRGIALIIVAILAKYGNNNIQDHPATSSLLNRKNTAGPAKPQRSGNGSQTASQRRLRSLVVHAEEQPCQPWHLMGPEEVLVFCETDRTNGLSPVLRAERIKKYGPNVLPESVPRSGWSIFVNQFMSLPVALLGIASVISVATGGFADAVVIIGVVGINAIIGYVTESGAERTINSLKNLVKPIALTLRDGKLVQIGAEEIAIGDLIVLRPGSYVAADARLIEAHHLTVDESALTGESLPVAKTVQPLLNNDTERRDDENLSLAKSGRNQDTPLADRTNMVYMGTLVTGGQGVAVVIATGRYTEIGQVQMLVGEASSPETPMEKELDKVGGQLVVISCVVCGVVGIIGLLRGYSFLQMLKSSISLAVAAVPEGLPAVATTTLALGIRNMKRHNVLIRRLEAVETLGSVQTICLDKTGTITMNQMTVTDIHTGVERMSVLDGKFRNDQGFVNPYTTEDVLKFIHICCLCNESEVFAQNGGFVVNGSSTENALLYMAINAGINVDSLRNTFPLIKTVHRSMERNTMFTWHGCNDLTENILAIKGSPSEVLAHCTSYMRGGSCVPLTDDDRERIEGVNEKMAGEALRLLGVAYAVTKNIFDLPENGDPYPCDVIWLGIVGMKDPIRHGLVDLIHAFHQAGIDTVMITGDQTPTAYAIGKALNLNKGEELEILDAVQFSDMPPDVFNALCERVQVFARVSPVHKLQIVQSLQSLGKTVAMTGDGINDGPALKAASIGIAMGHTGTDVAREVADVVLEDDNLQTMIIAISEGRTIYNNIRKSVHFLLSTNMSEIMIMFVGVALGLGEPLSTMQLLWINLLGDIFPGLALALEAPEPDVLMRPPRDPSEKLVRPSDFKRILTESGVISAGALTAYGYGIARYGVGMKANSLGFVSLSIGQLLHAISCRSETHSIFHKSTLPRNKYLEGALAGTIGLQVLALVVPGMRNFLGVPPLSIIDGAVVGGAAVLPLLVNEATKPTERKVQ